MEVKALSTTIISNWPDCPRRAWRSYERRLEMGDDNEGTDPTRFGTVVHNVQEEIHERCLREEASFAEVTDDYIMQVFDEKWQEGNCYDFEIYALGRDKIANFVRKSFVERLGTTVSTEFLFILEIETNRLWMPETREAGTVIVDEILKRGNTPVVSKIDRIDRYVDAAGDIHIKVYDYKTNILPFTRDYIENSAQLGLYAIVAWLLYPEAKSVECIFDMVRHGRFPVEFDQVFLADLRQYFINLWQQIKSASKPEERLNKYCRWCEIRSDCKEYAKALASDIPAVFTETVDTPEGIAAMYSEYERIANVLKLAKQRQDEIKIAISSKIEKDNLGEPLQQGMFEYYFQQNPRYDVNKSEVMRILTTEKALTLLPSIMSVSKTSIERGLKAYPAIRTQMMQHIRQTFNAPSLKRRELKGNKSNFEEADAHE